MAHRDEAEQLEFIGVEVHGGRAVARFRSLDKRDDGTFADGDEWLANRHLLEQRAANLIRNRAPRAATMAALAAVLAREATP